MLKDNLGVSWEEACASLMTEMRMYELECLRRRMEDAQAAAMAHKAGQDAQSVISSIKSPNKSIKSMSNSEKSSSKSPKSKRSQAEEKPEEEERFTGLSCLLITWKTNQEIENFKELYLESKTKRRDAQDLVSEKSLAKNYRIIGKVMSSSITKLMHATKNQYHFM